MLVDRGIECEVVPGVSSFAGAAAALGAELTLPGVSQTVILTRMEGRTPVPEKESIQSLASHGATMVIFLSSHMLKELSQRLTEGGYSADTPAAIIYKATWPDEKTVYTVVGKIAQAAEAHSIFKTALVMVGDFLSGDYHRSKLYDPDFTHGFRQGS